MSLKKEEVNKNIAQDKSTSLRSNLPEDNLQATLLKQVSPKKLWQTKLGLRSETP
jgi:hypothetical protein